MSPFVYPKMLGGRNLLRVRFRSPYTMGVNTRTTGGNNERSHAEAKRHEQAAIESFDRCDTDGFVSQWASGVMADEARLNAYLASKDGKDDFAALFDLDGNLVAAKLITIRYGLAWGLLATDDPSSNIIQFITAFPKRESTMTRKGFYEGTVRCPAHVAMSGSGTGLSGALSVHAFTTRNDRGFSRDVEIIDNGHGPKPERAGWHRS